MYKSDVEYDCACVCARAYAQHDELDSACEHVRVDCDCV